MSDQDHDGEISADSPSETNEAEIKESNYSTNNFRKSGTESVEFRHANGPQSSAVSRARRGKRRHKKSHGRSEQSAYPNSCNRPPKHARLDEWEGGGPDYIRRELVSYDHVDEFIESPMPIPVAESARGTLGNTDTIIADNEDLDIFSSQHSAEELAEKELAEVEKELQKRLRRQRKSREHFDKLRQRQQAQEARKFESVIQPCKFYREGFCNKGDECNFSHDIPQQRKMDLCKFYATGVCSKGDSCLFMHADFPCKFYHSPSGCRMGTTCKFSHSESTPEVWQLLDQQTLILEKKKETAEGTSGEFQDVSSAPEAPVLGSAIPLFTKPNRSADGDQGTPPPGSGPGEAPANQRPTFFPRPPSHPIAPPFRPVGFSMPRFPPRAMPPRMDSMPLPHRMARNAPPFVRQYRPEFPHRPATSRPPPPPFVERTFRCRQRPPQLPGPSTTWANSIRYPVPGPREPRQYPPAQPKSELVDPRNFMCFGGSIDELMMEGGEETGTAPVLFQKANPLGNTFEAHSLRHPSTQPEPSSEDTLLSPTRKYLYSNRQESSTSDQDARELMSSFTTPPTFVPPQEEVCLRGDTIWRLVALTLPARTLYSDLKVPANLHYARKDPRLRENVVYKRLWDSSDLPTPSQSLQVKEEPSFSETTVIQTPAVPPPVPSNLLHMPSSMLSKSAEDPLGENILASITDGKQAPNTTKLVSSRVKLTLNENCALFQQTLPRTRMVAPANAVLADKAKPEPSSTSSDRSYLLDPKFKVRKVTP